MGHLYSHATEVAYCYRQSSVVCRSVCLCLSVTVTVVSPAKTAEPIEISFGLWARIVARKHVLDGGAHWRNLLNITEPSMCGGDAVFCQITLTTSSNLLLVELFVLKWLVLVLHRVSR